MAKKAVWLILSCLLVVALVLASCGPAEVEEEEGKTVVGEVEERKSRSTVGHSGYLLSTRLSTPYHGTKPILPGCITILPHPMQRCC